MTEASNLHFDGLKILLVEDEYVIASDLKRILSNLGATILGPAPTIAAAEKILAANPQPDAAILDINVRGVLVYPIAEILVTRSVPFAFVTGYSFDIVPAEFASAPHCEKPVTARNIEAAVRDCLQMKSA
jgi:CheY-like chemotaxis protein